MFNSDKKLNIALTLQSLSEQLLSLMEELNELEVSAKSAEDKLIRIREIHFEIQTIQEAIDELKKEIKLHTQYNIN